MGKILNIQELNKLSDLKKANQKLVLVGGCFDILHSGHIDFLTRAKKAGDILIVMLEPDKKITELKGSGRPINLQNDRAKVLSNLAMVDYVITLPYLKSEENYEALVKKIEPDIIALTPEDRLYPWENQYKVVQINRINNHSTTGIIKRIRK